MRKGIRLGSAARRRLSIAAGAVVLAFGAIVLARARGEAWAPVPEPSEASATRIPIDTPELHGFIALTQGAVLSGGMRELFAELRLNARDLPGQTERRPVALAVALDVSGSMSGEKIEQARAAVQMLAASMRPEDRLAIIAYNHDAKVVQPLAPVGTVREELRERIDSLYAMGGTQIPGGLSLAAQALEDAPPSMIRRLVLISDGLDGSGIPLGVIQSDVATRANVGVSTSALGVGIDYDERWLTTVAEAGRGNYEFVAQGAELRTFLARELEQASSTVAERTAVTLNLPSGWRLANIYGARNDGGSVPIGPLFAGERRRVTMRFEVAAGAPGESADLGVGLRYHATRNSSDRNLDLGRLSLTVVADEAQVAASRDVTLHAEAVAQWVDARQADAIEAWRGGRTAEAAQLTNDNLAILRDWRAQAPQASPALDTRMGEMRNDLSNFDRVSAQSEEGRGYGLRSNATRAGRARNYE